MLACLFPGQGSQRVGMGSALLEERPELLAPYLADVELEAGLDLKQFWLEGPIEALTATDVAQPAIFTLSVALGEVARELGVNPAFAAGHSLGEYSAAVFSGALSWKEGLALVCLRGALMARVQDERPGAMGAVIGLDPSRVEELCERVREAGVVTVANLNSPLQTTVSGEVAAVERVLGAAREAGADDAVRLPVGAAFHSPLMAPVQERIADAFAAVKFATPSPPIVSNASATLLRTGEEVRHGLIEQITSPVRWSDSVRLLAAEGCASFLELGPGRVLTGLVRQNLDPDVKASAADSAARISAFLA